MKDFTPEQAAATVSVSRLDGHRANLAASLQEHEQRRAELVRAMEETDAVIAGTRTAIATLDWLIDEAVSAADETKGKGDAGATE